MEPYPSGQFGFIDDPDRQFGHVSVRTRTWTRSDGPEQLLTLLMVLAECDLRFICPELCGILSLQYMAKQLSYTILYIWLQQRVVKLRVLSFALMT